MAHTYAYGGYRDAWGTRQVRIQTITLVDNYATGGWPIAAKDMGFGGSARIEAIIPLQQAAGASFSWDRTNQKLIARDWAGAEIANAFAGLAGAVIPCLVISTGTQA